METFGTLIGFLVVAAFFYGIYYLHKKASQKLNKVINTKVIPVVLNKEKGDNHLINLYFEPERKIL